MPINNLLANPYKPRPVSNFLAGRRHAEQSQAHAQRGNMNALSMQNTQQTMQARQQTMQQAEQDNKLKTVAMYMKGVKTQADYTAATGRLKSDHGIESQPEYNDQTKQKINNILEHTGMADAAPEAYTLSAGQQRRSGNNDLVASAPAKPADPVQQYGASRPTVADPNRMGQFPVDEQGNETGGKGVNMYNVTEQVVTGSPSDFVGKSAEDKERALALGMRENVYAVEGAVDSLVSKLEASTNYVGGAAGTLVKIFNSASQQASQLGGKPDDLVGEDGKFNRDRISGDISKEGMSWLRKSAFETDTVGSAILELAFVHAKYLNNSGKISDADIKAARDIIESPDKAISIQKLNDLKTRAAQNYNSARKGRIDMKSYKHWTDLRMDGVAQPTVAAQAVDLTPEQQDEMLVDSFFGTATP